jgi:hypothetical protein
MTNIQHKETVHEAKPDLYPARSELLLFLVGSNAKVT